MGNETGNLQTPPGAGARERTSRRRTDPALPRLSAPAGHADVFKRFYGNWREALMNKSLKRRFSLWSSNRPKVCQEQDMSMVEQVHQPGSHSKRGWRPVCASLLVLL